MKMIPISVLVHTRNSAATLPALLRSVSWADEIIVVDMASEDNTVDLARDAGARVLFVDPHPRVDGIRNQFLSKPQNDWVLVLDSDERLPADAQGLISDLIEQHGTTYDAFTIPRFNAIGSQVLRGSGWYPDAQTRLFRKGTVLWTDTTHSHPEVVTGDERRLVLEPPGCLHIHHDNYSSLEEVIRRQLAYALNDVFPDDPDDYAMEEYIREAFWQYKWRNDPTNDGDVSRALAIVMAWDKVMRGLIHWNRLNPRPPLPDIFATPVVVTQDVNRAMEAEIQRLRQQLSARKEELFSMRQSTSWRLTAPLRRLRRFLPGSSD